MTYGNSSTQQERKGHSAPCSNRDFDFYYQGLEEQKLLIQKCSQCGTLRNPPGPACPHCRSLRWEPIALRGTGVIFSHTVHYHPPLPGFEVPHPIVIVDTDEGVRVVGAMDGNGEELKIGMRVNIEFLRRGEVAGFRFCRDLSSDAPEPASRG